jgi:glucose-6-phosphate dehydrogenase assembly protein OpcA
VSDAPARAGGSIVDKFSRGEAIAVEVADLERALSELWKESNRLGGSAEGVPSRAALWNVVIPTLAANLEATKKLVDELAPLVPVRAIMLAQELDGEAQDATSQALRATIESNVVSRPNGARVVYSEEITLRGRGGDEVDGGTGAHFGALVRALQIPGLPTATFWLDVAMPESLLRRQLLPVTDRLVVDTGTCLAADDLQTVQDAVALTRGLLPVADLGWLRLTNFRLLFAGLFDPPVGGAPLRQARRVVVHHREGAEVSALLLAAWLASTLGWIPVGADRRAGDGKRQFRFERADKAAGGAVELGLEVSKGECGTSGIVALELTAATPAGDALFAVARTERNYATLTSPIAPPKVVKLDLRRDAELCLAALGPGGRDPLFLRCLSLATRLATLAAGT